MVDMSTSTGLPSAAECRLYDFGSDLESGPDLFDPERMAERLTVLDQLDGIPGDWEGFPWHSNSAIIAELQALRMRLEAVNRELYEAARAEIIREGSSRRFRHWLFVNGGVPSTHGGLSFDVRDEIVAGVLQLHQPGEPEVPRSADMLAYQPTPARHVLDLIARCELSSDDVLVDLGSGLGHVPLLVSMLSGNETLGIELQRTYVACAQECAHGLQIRQARFVADDAQAADLSIGSVFYLYTPFTGSVLREVLDRLREESTKRLIRICSLGPCTRVLVHEPWLRASTPAETGRVAVFQSQ